jgi:hypothetical protein
MPPDAATLFVRSSQTHAAGQSASVEQPSTQTLNSSWQNISWLCPPLRRSTQHASSPMRGSDPWRSTSSQGEPIVGCLRVELFGTTFVSVLARLCVSFKHSSFTMTPVGGCAAGVNVMRCLSSEFVHSIFVSIENSS